MCKPNKLGQGQEKKLGHRGFGKLRDEIEADADLEMFGDDAAYLDYAGINNIGNK